jgi:hypothetical protein
MNEELTPEQIAAIENYCQVFGVSENAKRRIIEKHNWAKQESRRLGCYHPDANAQPAESGALSLSKIGEER